MLLAGLLEDQIIVDLGLAGLDVDSLEHGVGRVVRERRRPEELAGGAVEREDAARFADGYGDVALLTLFDGGVDPFDELRIGSQLEVQQRAFVGVIGIPVVTGQMLVIPVELAGGGIDGDG